MTMHCLPYKKVVYYDDKGPVLCFYAEGGLVGEAGQTAREEFKWHKTAKWQLNCMRSKAIKPTNQTN